MLAQWKQAWDFQEKTSDSSLPLPAGVNWDWQSFAIPGSGEESASKRRFLLLARLAAQLMNMQSP